MTSIEKNSEAWQELNKALTSPVTYKVSVDERPNGVAVKINEGVWSPTLSTQA